MKLQWNGRLSTIRMTLSDDSVILWSSSLWTRAGPVVNDSIFNLINGYMDSLPKTTLSKIESIYIDIDNYYNVPGLTDNGIKSYVGDKLVELLHLIDYSAFTVWCLSDSRMNLNIGIKVQLDDKDKERLTYFTEDYNNLVIMGELMKLIMPIWAGYDFNMKNHVGKDNVHMAAVELLYNRYILSLPSFTKLYDYVEYYVSEKVSSTGISLIKNIGKEELVEHLISKVLIKKIAVFNSSSPTDSIVTNVYHVLRQTCDSFNRGGPKEKQNKEEPGDEQTITDSFKIVQRQPPGVTVLLETYVRDYCRVANDIDPTVNLDSVCKSVVNFPELLDIEDYHITIISAVCVNVLNIRTIPLCEGFVPRTLLGVSAVILKHWGLDAVAALITTIPTPKDLYLMGEIKKINPRAAETNKRLDVIYPYKTGKSQGAIWIDGVVKRINSSDWDIPQPLYGVISEQLAELLIKIGE